MADEVVNDWPDRYLAKIGDELGPRDAVCVLTHDHKFDVPAIAAAVQTNVGYLGAMGSRRTHDERVERLREHGLVRRRDRAGDVADRARHRRPHTRGDRGRDLRGDHRDAHRPPGRVAARHHRPHPLTRSRPREESRGPRNLRQASSRRRGVARARIRHRRGAGARRRVRSRSAAGVATRSTPRPRTSAPAPVPLVADVSTPDGAAAFVREARDALGGIDILVANAGGPPPGRLREHDRRPVPRRVRTELPFVDRDVLRGGARDARPAVGEGARDHVDRGAAADPEPDPVEHGPGRAHGLPQDAGARGRGRRRDRELVAARTARDRAPHDAARRCRRWSSWAARSRPGRSAKPPTSAQVAAFLCSEPARFVTGTALPVDGGAYAGLL